MKMLRVALIALAIALVPLSVPAQSTVHDSVSAKQFPMATALALASAPLLRVADHRMPAPTHHKRLPGFPIEGLAAAALATKGKKATRRSAGKRSSVKLFLDSLVHVVRGEDKEGRPKTESIAGGVLVDDTDLTDDEIDELTALKAIRPATPKEIEQLDRNEVEEKRVALVREQEEEMAALRAEHEQAKADLGTDASPAKVTKLEEKQAAEVSKLQDKHTKALNKVAE